MSIALFMVIFVGVVAVLAPQSGAMRRGERSVARNAPKRLDIATKVGFFVVRSLNPNMAVSDYVVKSVGLFVVGFACSVVLFSIIPAVIIATVLALAPVYVKRRAIAEQKRQWERDLISVCDVLDLAASGGLSAMASIELVATRGDGPVAQEFRHVLELSRRGVPLADALGSVSENGYGVIGGLLTTLTDSHLFGSGLSRGVIQLRSDLSQRMRIRAETSAHKAPTKMLFPLALCILPAFVLLTIVPMVVSDLGQLHGLFR